jgi:ATP-dependent Lon protease
VRDEAEIRGHRRTYIGALPGRIVHALKKTGVNNPVLLLDEVDKLGRDVRGDPASALLEVLDPEQNHSFVDHFLNVPVDLSRVLFIATANDSDTIPQPLLDRMEVIRLSGYTFDEKLQIAQRHLLPKQLAAHGLAPDQLRLSPDVLKWIAVNYTREAGVRNFERELAAVCRALAVELASVSSTAPSPATPGAAEAVGAQVTTARVEEILGPAPFEDDVNERASIPGVAAGLAWTSSGSGGLLFIEATRMPGTGRLTLTGNLGDVIKESAQTALSWVRAHATELRLGPLAGSVASLPMASLLEKTDIHIHLPAGAVPKDGPSAGVTIVTALVSLLANECVRPATAMTGEITLRGLVLPVGGIKEKVLAAHRSGIRRVILPYRNQKNLVDVPATVRADMEFILAKRIADVLQAAFDPAWTAVFDFPQSHL